MLRRPGRKGCREGPGQHRDALSECASTAGGFVRKTRFRRARMLVRRPLVTLGRGGLPPSAKVAHPRGRNKHLRPRSGALHLGEKPPGFRARGDGEKGIGWDDAMSPRQGLVVVYAVLAATIRVQQHFFSWLSPWYSHLQRGMYQSLMHAAVHRSIDHLVVNGVGLPCPSMGGSV